MPAVAHAANTGILCDGLRVIDVDIDDPELAGSVRSLIVATFGDVPIRYRREQRTLRRALARSLRLAWQAGARRTLGQD